MLSLSAHVQAPSIYADMAPHKQSPRAMATAIAAAYALVSALYLGLGAFGLFSVRCGTWSHLEDGNQGGSENSSSCGDGFSSCGLCAGDDSLLCGDGDAAAPGLVVARACLALSALVSVALSHHPAREALWALARRGRPGASQIPRGFSNGDTAPMPRRFLWTETIAFAALAPALALATEAISEIRALVRLVRLAAGVVLIFLLPAACLRGSAAAGAQPRLRALARAFAAFGALCLALCGYAFVEREGLAVGGRGNI